MGYAVAGVKGPCCLVRLPRCGSDSYGRQHWCGCPLASCWFYESALARDRAITLGLSGSQYLDNVIRSAGHQWRQPGAFLVVMFGRLGGLTASASGPFFRPVILPYCWPCGRQWLKLQERRHRYWEYRTCLDAVATLIWHTMSAEEAPACPGFGSSQRLDPERSSAETAEIRLQHIDTIASRSAIKRFFNPFPQCARYVFRLAACRRNGSHGHWDRQRGYVVAWYYQCGNRFISREGKGRKKALDAIAIC